VPLAVNAAAVSGMLGLSAPTAGASVTTVAATADGAAKAAAPAQVSAMIWVMLRRGGAGWVNDCVVCIGSGPAGTGSMRWTRDSITPAAVMAASTMAVDSGRLSDAAIATAPTTAAAIAWASAERGVVAARPPAPYCCGSAGPNHWSASL
jgi:hypothetical protein